MLALTEDDDDDFSVSLDHPGDKSGTFGEVSLISLLLIDTKPAMRKKRRRRRRRRKGLRGLTLITTISGWRSQIQHSTCTPTCHTRTRAGANVGTVGHVAAGCELYSLGQSGAWSKKRRWGM